VGIGLGIAGSGTLAPVLKVPFVLDAGIIAIAFLFSAGEGLLFGYSPARRAARLDPIDALRHE